jgi:hypothetical protein
MYPLADPPARGPAGGVLPPDRVDASGYAGPYSVLAQQLRTWAEPSSPAECHRHRFVWGASSRRAKEAQSVIHRN